jgi:hypothetical protein
MKQRKTGRRAPSKPRAGANDPRLSARAAEAWVMLARPTAPMLPHAAVDWVRQEAECEDVRAVKRALFRAAGEWLEDQRKDELRGSVIHQRIKEAKFDDAAEQARDLRSVSRDWHPWYKVARRVIALCRQLESV